MGLFHFWEAAQTRDQSNSSPWCCWADIHLWFMGTCEYTPSGLDVAQQKWSGAGIGGDGGLTNAKSIVFTRYHVSLGFPLGSLMSWSFSASWPWPKESHTVTSPFLLRLPRAASSLGTHEHDGTLQEPWLSKHKQNVCSASTLTNFGSIIILPVLMWSCLCLSQHCEAGTARFCSMRAYRVGSFIMYPLLTEKRHLPPGEEGGELLSEFFSVPPSTSHGFRANIHKVSFAFNLRTWTRSHSNYSLPAVVCPLLRVVFHLYAVWIQWRK